MISGFVTNDSLTHMGVQEILRNRCTYATGVSSVYNVAHDLLMECCRNKEGENSSENNNKEKNNKDNSNNTNTNRRSS